MGALIHRLSEWDKAIFNTVNQSWSSDILDFILITWRNPYVWVPVYVFVIAWVFFQYQKKGYWVIVFFILTATSTDMISSKVIKPTVERSRPCHQGDPDLILRVRCGQGYSFTSSHATNHAGFATLLFLLFGYKIGRVRHVIWMWAVVVCIAQVYVGVHYPSDVLCGAMLGTIIGYFWYQVFMRFYGQLIFPSQLTAHV